MKNKGIAAAVILAAVITIPAAVYAGTAAYTKNITVTYGVTVTKDGSPVKWIDSNGKEVSPFIYQDTAYVPLKTLAPLLGASSQYTYENNTVNIITDGSQGTGTLQASGGEFDVGYSKSRTENQQSSSSVTSQESASSGSSRWDKYHKDTTPDTAQNTLTPNYEMPDWILEAELEYYNMGKEYLDAINNGTAQYSEEWLETYEKMGETIAQAKEAELNRIETLNRINSGTAVPSVSSSSKSYTFPLHLYSNDGKVYLGKCVTDRFDDDSIWYPLIGDYSSEYSSTSIWNKYGEYGGTLLSYDESAFNDRAENPPVIVDSKGTFVAYLTTNEDIENGWTIYELRRFVEDNGQ